MNDPELELLLEGEAAAEAAQALRALLAPLGEALRVAPRQPPEPGAAGRKAVDPLALAALVVALPATALAAWDLADRIRQRRRAEQLIEAARQVQVQQQVNIFVVGGEGPEALDRIKPERLLDLATELARRPPQPAGPPGPPQP